MSEERELKRLGWLAMLWKPNGLIVWPMSIVLLQMAAACVTLWPEQYLDQPGPPNALYMQSV